MAKQKVQSKAGPAIGKSAAFGALSQLSIFQMLKKMYDSIGTVPGENIYTKVIPPEERTAWEASRIFDKKEPFQRSDWAGLSPDEVAERMGTTGIPEPSQKQLLAGEPDLKFLNKDIYNSILADQRRQVKEGLVDPNDVLSGADLSAFYNEIYKPGVDPKQAIQNLAEKLFIQRGVEKGAERAVSDVEGKLTSFKQPTIKGANPHRITQRLAKTYIPDDATFVDPQTGMETPVTQEELIAAGIIPPVKKKTTTGGMYGGTGSGSGFSGFTGFGNN
jgi:hypothetical protein